jgi:FixJ family two-component response regulator
MLAAMSSLRTIYIAVIDDDESTCRSMGRLLRAAHLQPVTYPSAESFLTDTNRPMFACLVLDIQLTGMSGLELQQRLAAAKDVTPVVFITAQDDPAERAQAEASGCASYFSKTKSGTDILAAIRRAIGPEDPEGKKEGWELTNGLHPLLGPGQETPATEQ